MKRTKSKVPLVYKEMPIYNENYKEIGSKIFWSRDFLEIAPFGNKKGENYLKIKVVNQDWEKQRLHKPCPPLDFIVKENDIDELIQVFEGTREPIQEVTKGMLALLMAVITDVTNDYRMAWQKGAKHQLQACELFILSGRVELWTMGEFHSDFIIRNLKETLTSEYGSFESIYQAKVDKCNAHLQPIYDELDKYDRNYLIDTRLGEDSEWFKDFEHRQYLSNGYAKKIREIESEITHIKLLIEDENGNTYFQDTIPNTPHNKPLVKLAMEYKDKKKALGLTTKEREKHARLEKLIELTKKEKARVKYLEKKAMPWELLLNE